jgi:hypothetical protein
MRRIEDGFTELIVVNATLAPVTVGNSDVIDPCAVRAVPLAEIRTSRAGYPPPAIWNMFVPPLLRPDSYEGPISVLVSVKGALILYTDLRTKGSPDCRGVPPPESRDLHTA